MPSSETKLKKAKARLAELEADEGNLSIGDYGEIRKLNKKIPKLENRVQEKKVFSTTMIAQQARKAAAREEQERAVREEKPVLKRTIIKKVFSPKVVE